MASPTNLLDQEPESQTQGILVAFWIGGLIAIMGTVILGMIILSLIIADDEFEGRNTEQPEGSSMIHGSYALNQTQERGPSAESVGETAAGVGAVHTPVATKADGGTVLTNLPTSGP